MAENPRTTSARDHDDHEVIDDAVASPHLTGSGGAGSEGLAGDIATQADQAAISEPDATVRPKKDDAIHHNQARPSARANGATG